jgi:N-glycosylase/DNA lyase
MNKIDELKRSWGPLRGKIAKRLGEFRGIWLRADRKTLFKELVFCLFTPQSKARSCWLAVEELDRQGLLQNGGKAEISKKINTVRFRNNKAGYVVVAREFLAAQDIDLRRKISGFKSESAAREWLVENIKGLGYKEASHFLRNIGYSKTLAILDRHILKNLCLLGVINKIPSTISKKVYLEMEVKFRRFAEKAGIPLNHLDLLFWAKEAGEIFK